MADDVFGSSTTTLPILSDEGVGVANQSSATADYSGGVERQRRIAHHEMQQRDIREQQQIELRRQQTASMLEAQRQSHREEASIALGSVTNLTENTLNRINKQSQEIQQMSVYDERTRQMITARKNQLRNQAKERESRSSETKSQKRTSTNI